MRNRLPRTVAFLLLAAVPLLSPVSLPAQELRIEAEGYMAFRDLHEPAIRGVNNPSCSGGVSLAGLDSPGEWVSYRLEVPAEAAYSLSVHFRARAGKPVTLKLQRQPEGGAAPASGDIDLSLQGSGFG